MRVFPVRGKGIGVHAKKIFARRRVIHRSCGEQTLRALLASVNNSGGTISQKEEARRAFRRRVGRKDKGRRREYQTGGLTVISFRR
jgi:hypothetical protein